MFQSTSKSNSSEYNHSEEKVNKNRIYIADGNRFPPAPTSNTPTQLFVDEEDTLQKKDSELENNVESTVSEESETSTELEEIKLSRGVLQLISEGNFSGGSGDTRKPHFPQNIWIFQKLTSDEKSDDKSKMYSGKRFSGPDDIGRFTESDSGDFKRVSLQNRFSVDTYSKTLETGQQLGTMGGQSGVTIGFGLDIGNKWNDVEKAKKFFTDSGISSDVADKLSCCVGVKGLEAAKKTATLRSEISITTDNILSLLKNTIPDYDSKGYTRGDGIHHAVIEEVLNAAYYWGNTSLRKGIISACKDKDGVEQFEAARDFVKTKLDAAVASGSWKVHGYKCIYHFLHIATEAIAKGHTISMSDAVKTKSELIGDGDNTFEFVRDVTERKQDFKLKGKDFKKQLGETAIPDMISKPVGEGADNQVEDVETIQQLLYNGNYDVDINGSYDEKTKNAIAKFMNDSFGKAYATIDPHGKTMRYLKQFKYSERNESGNDSE